MIKKLLTLLLFYSCTLVLPVEAAITRGVGPVLADGDTTALVAVLTGTTIGRMIVIVVGYATSIDSVTISGEADATRVVAADMTANGDKFAIFYLANNTAGGDKTITINISSLSYVSAVVIEYAGQDTSSQPDATTTPTTGVTGDPTLNITTVTPGDLIVTMCSSNSGKPTMPSGYSDYNFSNPGYYANAADNVAAGGIGAKTLIWTDVTNSSWGVTAVAFKAVSVGGGSTVRHRVIGQ